MNTGAKKKRACLNNQLSNHPPQKKENFIFWVLFFMLSMLPAVRWTSRSSEVGNVVVFRGIQVDQMSKIRKED